MQKLFIKGLGITLLLNLLIKPATIFGVDVEMQKQLGNEAYGTFQAVLNFTFLFSMVLDMGVTNYMTRLIAQYPHLIRQYSHQLFTLRVVLMLIYIGWSCFLFIWYQSNAPWWLLGMLLLHQININTVNYVRAYTGGLMKFTMDAILSVIERLVYLFLGITLLYTNFVEPMSLSWFVGAFVAASFISLVFAIFVYVSLVEFPRWKWNTTFFTAIFKQTFPYASLVILMMLCLKIDSVILREVHPDGAKQVGYYTQGFRLLEACWMFGILFGSLLLPVFSKLLKEKGSVSVIMTNAFNILIAGGILMITISMGMVQIIFDGLYKESAAPESYASWTYLSMTFIPMCFTIVFGTFLTALGSMRQLNIIALIGLIISVVLHCSLAPFLGAEGAAIATFVAQTVLGLLQWGVIRYTMDYRLEKGAWTKLMVMAVVMIAMMVAQWIWHFSPVMWTATVLLVWVTILFGLKIIDLQKMLLLLLKRQGE